ncbi:transposase [Chloroflexi bacterium TSY]|nr:transposase [Chloroflexi bacterium TSY]
MARRDVQFVQGAYYHIYNRGTNRSSIFLRDEDYKDVLRRMKHYTLRFNLSVIAYCLMPNHYHWLIRQDGEVEARWLPQRAFNGYVRTFNNRNQRTGTLFEGPFVAILVDKDEYLNHLCRYIHGNPVKDGFALRPELWPYSNYSEWMGLRNGTLVDHGFIQEFFPDIEQYRKSVMDYLTNLDSLPDELQKYLSNIE